MMVVKRHFWKRVIGLLKQIRDNPKENVQLDRIEAQVDLLVRNIRPRLAVAFRLKITNDKGEIMAKAIKGKLRFDINSDGSAVATLDLEDPQGFDAQLVSGDAFDAFPWKSSDPGIVVAPAADNMSAKLTVKLPPANPASPPTGVVITVGPATLTRADGTTAAFAAVDNSADPLNVKAGPAGMFSITVA
jgi:hypothetical protein